jgi:hypothetical protein
VAPQARLAWGLLVLVLPTVALAQVGKRIALLTGNQAYTPEIGVLANPHNDVALLERKARQLFGVQRTKLWHFRTNARNRAANCP